MTDLVIYGAGGLGREVETLVRAADPEARKWNFLGFLDDGKPLGAWGGAEILGDAAWLTSRRDPAAVVLGLASPSAKQKIFESLRRYPHVSFPAIRHPTALIAPDSVLGEGAVVAAFCVVAPGAEIGRGAFLNWHSSVGHDAVLGEFCSVMPGVNISGGVRVGARTLIGAGAKILQGLSIGADATVGIGGVVVADIRDRTTVVGNPARVIKG
ncbi:MAG: NeuD/PglB/VioB family sugar acetyltransferase [Synergistaceae bacterium]|jgi:sugar O-acyltransferase (sialic acid O-acetyltransferase NeuD family)|nr:NeuD/PglB/VioB family sugar acetyltransferase [Synergistaceae bacterium]